MNEMVKNIIMWVVIAFVLMSVFNNFGGTKQASSNALSYSQFINSVNAGQVSKVSIDGPNIIGQTASGERFTTRNPGDAHLIDDLLKSGVEIVAKPPEETSAIMSVLISWFPMLLLIGVWIFFMRQMQGGGGAGGRGAMSFGKSKAKLLNEDEIKVTFADVAGVQEAKEEVAEIVEFLREPGKFQKLGGAIPRGILMSGAPGTGKTLLAKAIAGEAKVPFFSISGSDFVEMFVGVGASRVRDMFEQAKKSAPCIIFIDEIDAVGRARGIGMGGGNDEREQTLNQLLVEMDGFSGNEGVIVIAATNRPDVLDPALLRPGRFDRQVEVPLPDIRGREQILKVHLKKVPVGDSVSPNVIARGTPGMSGADLANLVNEAALFAARANKKVVDMNDMENAKDKVLMGAERRSMVMTDEEKRCTAYHESGHAIVGRLVPEHDPVYKITIIPRGRALGVTMFLPEKDAISISKRKLESQLSSLYGGRLAEEIIFGEEAVTTGASNDIERASAIARNMVTLWGFSEKLGALNYGEDENAMGHSGGRPKMISEETAELINKEVRVFIDRNYERAETLLKDNIDILHSMTDALMKYETLDSDQLDELMARTTVSPPKDWEDNDESGSGSVSTAGKEKDADIDDNETKPTVGGPAEQP
ncbi:MAG TPA: ATP-dependent zinc metalloprotease FtsH [Cycloclasticus sp.]|nr:ATP-dependent zinc metalloprotease FtsH [Cycloclasticus sp.]HIL92592.1 ATP-dependent zinc metalloprotease FtsH [Cycloclasticus sp.]